MNKDRNKTDIYVQNSGLKYFLKNMSRLNNHNGFTLLELMVVIAIFLIITSCIFAVLITGKRAWNISETQVDINSEARKALQRMTQELSLTSPSRFTITSISADEDNLTFQTPSSYAARIVVWGDQIQYSLGGINAEQFLRTNLNTLEVEVLSNNVTRLLFNNPSADLLSITMEITKQSSKGDNLRFQLTSQVALRNR